MRRTPDARGQFVLLGHHDLGFNLRHHPRLRLVADVDDAGSAVTGLVDKDHVRLAVLCYRDGLLAVLPVSPLQRADEPDLRVGLPPLDFADVVDAHSLPAGQCLDVTATGAGISLENVVLHVGQIQAVAVRTRGHAMDDVFGEELAEQPRAGRVLEIDGGDNPGLGATRVVGLPVAGDVPLMVEDGGDGTVEELLRIPAIVPEVVDTPCRRHPARPSH